LVASVVIDTPPEATNVRVSEFASDSTSVCPDTAIFLKILCDDPVSELVIFKPSKLTPDPASRVIAPVLVWKEVTPVLLIVGVCPVDMEIPLPALRE
jgi:hypothetical protein